MTSRASVRPMETIHESSLKAPVTPGPPAEAMLFSVVRTDQRHQNHQQQPAMMMPSTGTRSLHNAPIVDYLSGRSASQKVLVSRKASYRMRGWVKRSSSSRAAHAATSSTARLSTSQSMKVQIRHLGGGRVEEGQVEVGATSSNLLTPGATREQRIRASSIDSRLTQWLDFYPGPPEISRAPRRPSPESLLAEPSGDLRPAPLRVPSLEKQSSASAPSNILVRKNSKWKPLPRLPSQAVETQQPVEGVATVETPDRTETAHESRQESPATPGSTPEPPKGQDEAASLPVVRYGTPPPTPDSSADGTARMYKAERKHENDKDDAINSEKPQLQHATECSVRHTRHERIWLHVNYRGEAPFLRAWGLDITKLSDRLEGLSILRDLIQAEDERQGPEGQGSVAIQG
ncbi:hypothetical protein VTK56DRAFT_10026 [Thermocarpiscus australiensis]